MTYSTRFSSAIARGLLKMTDEEAVRAGVVSEHSAVKRVLQSAQVRRDTDWVNAWTVAFECMITGIADAFKGNALFLKTYQKLHKRAYRDIKRAMDCVFVWIDDKYVPTDSDGVTDDEEAGPIKNKVETSDGRQYSCPANGNKSDLAKLIQGLIIPEFTLTNTATGVAQTPYRQRPQCTRSMEPPRVKASIKWATKTERRAT